MSIDLFASFTSEKKMSPPITKAITEGIFEPSLISPSTVNIARAIITIERNSRGVNKEITPIINAIVPQVEDFFGSLLSLILF
jgi:hypothetical protein